MTLGPIGYWSSSKRCGKLFWSGRLCQSLKDVAVVVKYCNQREFYLSGLVLLYSAARFGGA